MCDLAINIKKKKKRCCIFIDQINFLAKKLYVLKADHVLLTVLLLMLFEKYTVCDQKELKIQVLHQRDNHFMLLYSLNMYILFERSC